MVGQIDSSFSFKPLVERDFKLVFEWQQQAHVSWWWQVKTDWPNFVKKYKQYIKSDHIFPFIINFEGVWIGYIHYYFLDKLQCADWHKFLEDTRAVVGIDIFIGEPDYVAKGYGTKCMQAFIKYLFKNPKIKTIIVDPRPENIHAVNCFRKVGFIKISEFQSDGGDVIVMALNRSSINF